MSIKAIVQHSKTYFPELDFIKVVAIIFVVAFHYFGEISGWHLHVVYSEWFFEYFRTINWLGLIKFIEGYMYMGVNIFVIASGFGLYLSYLKNQKKFILKDFFTKRILRLLPGVIFGTFVVFLIKDFILQDTAIFSNWWLNLFPFFGGLNLFSDNWFFPPINGEAWFFGLIIQLYLFFPILIKLLDKFGEKKFLLLLFTVCVLFRTAYYFYFQHSVMSLSYGLSIGRLFEFGFGMVMAKILFEGRKLSPLWILGLLLFFGYFFAWSFPFTDALFGVGLFALLWILVQSKPFTQSKAVADISAQSYMIFLTHHVFIWIIFKYGVNFGFQDAWSLYGVAIFVLLFIFSYFFAKGCNGVLKLMRLQ